MEILILATFPSLLIRQPKRLLACACLPSGVHVNRTSSSFEQLLNDELTTLLSVLKLQDHHYTNNPVDAGQLRRWSGAELLPASRCMFLLLPGPLMSPKSHQGFNQAQQTLRSSYAPCNDFIRTSIKLTVYSGRRSGSSICVFIYSNLRLHRQEPTSTLLYHTQEVQMEVMDSSIVEARQKASSGITGAVDEWSRYGGNVVCAFYPYPIKHRTYHRFYERGLHC